MQPPTLKLTELLIFKILYQLTIHLKKIKNHKTLKHFSFLHGPQTLIFSYEIYQI